MDGATGIVTNNQGELLLVKRRDVPAWVFPGGGIEKEETPEDATIREVLEESGYNVKIDCKIAEYSYKNSKKLVHVFKCTVISGYARTSSESKEVAFFRLDNLPNPRHPFVDRYIKDMQQNNHKVIRKVIEPLKTKEILRLTLKYPIPALRYFLLKLGLRINT